MTQLFGKDETVVFGDINLSENRVQEVHNVSQEPGSKGWPTIRFFNKETGFGGAHYPKRFKDEAMCDELGNSRYMQDYIQDMGRTLLCDPVAVVECSTKEQKFIEEWKVKTKEEAEAESEKLAASKKKDKDKRRRDRNRAKLLKKLAPTLTSSKGEL
mmetsp:Transcript_85879/g.148704  ORF Transcript_85879/g.148704 Transcript_85879/m.148704 type:complete len:157 (-) Transcript_85879:41-511(-)